MSGENTAGVGTMATKEMSRDETGRNGNEEDDRDRETDDANAESVEWRMT